MGDRRRPRPPVRRRPRRARRPNTSGGNSCCGPHVLEWDASLFTQRGEVEVDLLAGHQPLAERHDIRERHRESYRRPERRQASRHGSSRGGFPTPRRRRRRKPWPRPREQDQEMQKRTASRRPLSQRTGPRFGDRPASSQGNSRLRRSRGSPRCREPLPASR